MERPMDLEIYVNGTEIPALYDFYVDVEGTIFTMNPPPPYDPISIFQMVLEPDVELPNANQREAIKDMVRGYHLTVHIFPPLTAI